LQLFSGAVLLLVRYVESSINFFGCYYHNNKLINNTCLFFYSCFTMKTNNKYTLNFFFSTTFYLIYYSCYSFHFSHLIPHFCFYFHPIFLILLIMLINFSYVILSRLKLVYLLKVSSVHLNFRSKVALKSRL
jgi:hypothetical protein